MNISKSSAICFTLTSKEITDVLKNYALEELHKREYISLTPQGVCSNYDIKEMGFIKDYSTGEEKFSIILSKKY